MPQRSFRISTGWLKPVTCKVSVAGPSALTTNGDSAKKRPKISRLVALRFVFTVYPLKVTAGAGMRMHESALQVNSWNPIADAAGDFVRERADSLGNVFRSDGELAIILIGAQ